MKQINAENTLLYRNFLFFYFGCACLLVFFIFSCLSARRSARRLSRKLSIASLSESCKSRTAPHIPPVVTVVRVLFRIISHQITGIESQLGFSIRRGVDPFKMTSVPSSVDQFHSIRMPRHVAHAS